MRAVRLVQLGKPLEQADIPIPELAPLDVLIRVAAAGICHSDAHYRAGISKIDNLPLTLGHEIAGRVEEVGSDVTHLSAGDRVCLHYLVSCGSCEFCGHGLEQFCRTGEMIGKHRDGGYAEFKTDLTKREQHPDAKPMGAFPIAQPAKYNCLIPTILLTSV